MLFRSGLQGRLTLFNSDLSGLVLYADGYIGYLGSAYHMRPFDLKNGFFTRYAPVKMFDAETLLSKKFIRGEFKNGLANHLVYSGAFVVHKKLLQIEISFQMKSGLLGDYLDVKGSYDGSGIGEFHALRSYAGGGANGTWPTLDGESWAVRFILKQPGDKEPEGCFSIQIGRAHV